MNDFKLNTRLIKFVAILVLLFSLPLITLARTLLQAGANTSVPRTTLHTTARPASKTVLPLPAAGKDWPMYLHDPQRSSSTGETILAPANVGQLTKRWSFQTSGGIAASTTVVAGTVYFGSWDGYEYALDELTGALKWKTYLGRTVAERCYPTVLGLTSSAAVQNGMVYVGGGDAYWYALDAKTGTVLWRVYTGDNSAASGHYNWSSPLLYNGDAYIGIASNCDKPLVQGQVFQVSLQTHQIVHTFNLVPNGDVGGGVWTSPSVDPATNSLFVSTGTQLNPQDTLAQSLVVLDATTLALKSWWHLPAQDAIGDSDFDTSPILFTAAKGTPFVATVNKNGYIYVFNRNNVAAGPIWKQLIDLAGMCPICEESSVASSTFGQGRLYVAAGNTAIDNDNYRGSVQALDPTTGRFLWRHGTIGAVIGALVYTNGLVIDGAGRYLEVLDAATGARLYSYATGDLIYASPSVSHGLIFVGSTDGRLYAFGLPTTAPTSSSPDRGCPKGWSCQDIGNPILVGSETKAGNTWSVMAGGTGVTGASDQFRFVAQNVSGDMQLSAQVLSQEEAGMGGFAHAGLMARQATDPASPYYAVFLTAHKGVVVQYRSDFGDDTVQDVQLPTAAPPLYLGIERSGEQFQAATSYDGIHYTLVPGGTVALAMPTTVNVGLAVSSDDVETMNTAVYREIAIGLPGSPFGPPSSPTPCPGGWNCDDVGNPAILGSQSLHDNTWTVQSAGEDIWGNADQFYYIWRYLAGNGQLSVRVVSQQAKGSYAKAGIMVRQSLLPSSPYYAVFVESGKVANSANISVETRNRQGLISTQVAAIGGSAPIYLRITRAGDTYSAYASNDGTTWTLIPGSTTTVGLGGTPLAGMALSSHGVDDVTTATFDNVTVG